MIFSTDGSTIKEYVVILYIEVILLLLTLPWSVHYPLFTEKS